VTHDPRQSVKSNKDECLAMVEQIHEILCTIIGLYYASEIHGVLSPSIVTDIAKFSE
jgi:hypothetical protein